MVEGAIKLSVCDQARYRQSRPAAQRFLQAWGLKAKLRYLKLPGCVTPRLGKVAKCRVGASGQATQRAGEREREREGSRQTQTTMANFATLESLKKGDEEEKKGNAYYAGGARGAGRGGRFVFENGTNGRESILGKRQ